MRLRDSLTFNLDSHGIVTRVYLNRLHVATYVKDGNAYSFRWGHLDHPTPGYIEHFGSEEEAKAAIVSWVDSLDFEPWE